MSLKSIHAMSSEQASHVKKSGHKKEERFNSFFGTADYETNYSSPSADNIICSTNPANAEINRELSLETNGDIDVSLKSSRTIQIHLGNIPELTNKERLKVTGGKGKKPTIVEHGISFNEQKEQLTKKEFWRKYLKKGDVLCYDSGDTYVFFNMEDVIDFIVKKCHWRILETGRLKGDFFSAGKFKQILTYEYRSKKKSFVLGAHGGSKGAEFISLLKENIKYYSRKQE